MFFARFPVCESKRMWEMLTVMMIFFLLGLVGVVQGRALVAARRTRRPGRQRGGTGAHHRGRPVDQSRRSSPAWRSRPGWFQATGEFKGLNGVGLLGALVDHVDDLLQ